MPRIFLVAFRGIGRTDHFGDQPGLIRLGHVGIAFEGREGSILGFHPTAEAIQQIGGDDLAYRWLKTKHVLDGTLQEDYAVFVRAFRLAQRGARTSVWQLPLLFSEDVFEQIIQQATQWYNEQISFPYAFPTESIRSDQDNCATFPRYFSLPVPSGNGLISEYVQVLQAQGEPWKPIEA